jgi:hypothetical protein
MGNQVGKKGKSGNVFKVLEASGPLKSLWTLMGSVDVHA